MEEETTGIGTDSFEDIQLRLMLLTSNLTRSFRRSCYYARAWSRSRGNLNDCRGSDSTKPEAQPAGEQNDDGLQPVGGVRMQKQTVLFWYRETQKDGAAFDSALLMALSWLWRWTS